MGVCIDIMSLSYYPDFMVTITVKIPPEWDFLLETEAGRKKTSKSEMIRSLLEKGFRSFKSRRETSCYDLAKDLCGSIKKAPKDLSTNKKYMEGFGE